MSADTPAEGGRVAAEPADLGRELSRPRRVHPRPGVGDELGVPLLLAGHERGQHQRGAAAGRLGDRARARLPDHDVGAAEPVGHVADEALGGQPPVPGPLGQAADPPPQRAVAAADDDDVHVRHLAQDRGGAAAQPAGPFGAAGEHDEELAPEPELAFELAPLRLVERRAAELGRDRQPERHVAAGRGAVAGALVRDHLGRHHHPVDGRVDPGQVRGHQVGDDGDGRRGRAGDPARADGRVRRHRVERHDQRGAAGLDRPLDAAVDRGHDRPAEQAQPQRRVARPPERPPQPRREPDAEAVQAREPAEQPGHVRAAERIADDRREPPGPHALKRLLDRGRGATMPAAGIAYEEEQRQGRLFRAGHRSPSPVLLF